MPGWKGWSALDGQLSGGQPVVGQNADGRLEVFAEAPGGVGPELGHIWQLTAGGGWGSWDSLGAPPPPAAFLGFPRVARNADGRLEAFVRVGLMSTGALWHIWQTLPNGGWSSWDNLGGGIGPHHLEVDQNADGRLEVVAVNTIGQLVHIWQLTPGGAWGPWDVLGTPPGGIGLSLAIVGQNADGRLEVFADGSDGGVWHIWQTVPNGGWSSWDTLGKAGGLATRVGCVGRNADGRLELFAQQANAIWHIWQTAPNGGWSSWGSLGTPPGATVVRDPVVGTNADGRLELFVPDLNGDAWHIWQTTAGGGWSAWDSLGGEPTSLGVGANGDGRLEVFAEARVPTGTHPMWHRWQLAPSGGWSDVEDWEQLAPAGPAQRLFTPLSGAVLVRTTTGLFRSDDHGSTWNAINLPPSPSQVVAVDPTDPSVIYAGGSGAIYKTTNGGGSWSTVHPTPPNQFAVGLAVSPANHSVIYCALGPYTFTFLRSTDGGTTWATLEGPLPNNLCIWTVLILMPHPSNVNRVLRTSGCYAGRNVPFGDALRQSTDQGATWTDLVHPTPLFPSVLAGGAGAQPGRYYMGAHFAAPPGGGKLYRSDDDGVTWTTVLTYSAAPSVEGLAYHPNTPDHVYAGLTDGTVQESADGGTSWAQLGTGGLGGVEDLALALDQTYLYAATTSGVWRIPR